MNLWESLPDFVEINGERYKLHTDFKKWLELISKIKSGEEIRYDNFYCRKMPSDEKERIDGIIKFLLLNKEEATPKGASSQRKNTFSFDEDAPFIASAFLRCYGIDLFDTNTKMHWWKFRILLDGLPSDTEIKKRIMYRSIDPGSIKDRKERARIRKIQKEIALPQDVLTDYEIGSVF